MESWLTAKSNSLTLRSSKKIPVLWDRFSLPPRPEKEYSNATDWRSTSGVILTLLICVSSTNSIHTVFQMPVD